MSDDITYNLHARIDARYPRDKGWVVFHELRQGPGYGSARTIDAFAVNTWDSKRLFVALECKANLQDFRRETPQKRAPFIENSNEFWYVAPRGVIPVDELPEGCGLMETWGEDGLRATKRPVQRDAVEPDTDIFLMMLRAVQYREEAERLRLKSSGVAKVLGKPATFEQLVDIGRRAAHWNEGRELRDLEHENKRLKKDRTERRDWWAQWRDIVNMIRNDLDLSYTDRNDPSLVATALRGWIAARKASERPEVIARQLREAAAMIDGAMGRAE